MTGGQGSSGLGLGAWLKPRLQPGDDAEERTPTTCVGSATCWPVTLGHHHQGLRHYKTQLVWLFRLLTRSWKAEVPACGSAHGHCCCHSGHRVEEGAPGSSGQAGDRDPSRSLQLTPARMLAAPPVWAHEGPLCLTRAAGHRDHLLTDETALAPAGSLVGWMWCPQRVSDGEGASGQRD